MKEFIEIKEYGKLFVDKVIFESNFPILFTCMNEKKELFVCVCCQNNERGCKWLIGKTDSDSIILMLQDEITVRELLLKYSTGRISVDYVNGKYTISYDNSDWENESIFLPKEDSYLEAEEDEFAEEIKYYSSLESIRYNQDFYKNISTAFGTAVKEMQSVSKITPAFASGFGKITISGEILKTLEVFGKVGKNSYNTSKEMLVLKFETNNTITDAA